MSSFSTCCSTLGDKTATTINDDQGILWDPFLTPSWDPFEMLGIKRVPQQVQEEDSKVKEGQLLEAFNGYLDKHAEQQLPGQGQLGEDGPPPTPSPTPTWSWTAPKTFTFPEVVECVAGRQAPIGSEMLEFIRNSNRAEDEALAVVLPPGFDWTTMDGDEDEQDADQFLEGFLYDFRMRYFYDCDFRRRFRKQLDLTFVGATNMAHVQEVLNDTAGHTNSVASYCQLVHRYLEDLYSMYNLVSTEDDRSSKQADFYRIPGTIPAFDEDFNGPPAHFWIPKVIMETTSSNSSKNAPTKVPEEEIPAGDVKVEVEASHDNGPVSLGGLPVETGKEDQNDSADGCPAEATNEATNEAKNTASGEATKEATCDAMSQEGSEEGVYARFLITLKKLTVERIVDQKTPLVGADKIREWLVQLNSAMNDDDTHSDDTSDDTSDSLLTNTSMERKTSTPALRV